MARIVMDTGQRTKASPHSPPADRANPSNGAMPPHVTNETSKSAVPKSWPSKGKSK